MTSKELRIVRMTLGFVFLAASQLYLASWLITGTYSGPMAVFLGGLSWVGIGFFWAELRKRSQENREQGAVP